MGLPPLEIERRFRILDATKLPPLGAPMHIIQCYLPHWKIELGEDELCFDGQVIVPNLSKNEIRGLQDSFGDKIRPRLRLVDSSAFVTVKGPLIDGTRIEWEWEVSPHLLKELVNSMRFPNVLKRRYEIQEINDLVWEIDFFEGDNYGLVLAEIELPSVDAGFPRPDWLGPEVTEDDRFGNGSLAREPWCDLREEL